MPNKIIGTAACPQSKAKTPIWKGVSKNRSQDSTTRQVLTYSFIRIPNPLPLTAVRWFPSEVRCEAAHSLARHQRRRRRKLWESDSLLRAGRLATLEIVLDDSSVSRRHAEVRSTPNGWRMRDLGSTNGTFLNGTRLGPGEWPVCAARHRPLRQRHPRRRHAHAKARTRTSSHAPPTTCSSRPPPATPGKTPSTAWPSTATAARGPASSCWPCCAPAITSSTSKAKKTCCTRSSTTPSARSTPSAAPSSWPRRQRARSRLRALASGHSQVPSRPGFSQNLAQRSLQPRRVDPVLQRRGGPRAGRRPQHRRGHHGLACCASCCARRARSLGVLHLDRGPLQKPFTKDDLHLADALAANVSAGIESAQLLRKQRELFFATITMLAQAVELRDQYTGGHTARVTEYSYPARPAAGPVRRTSCT